MPNISVYVGTMLGTIANASLLYKMSPLANTFALQVLLTLYSDELIRAHAKGNCHEGWEGEGGFGGIPPQTSFSF
jgi:hypothetical protein